MLLLLLCNMCLDRLTCAIALSNSFGPKLTIGFWVKTDVTDCF
jgi:hypothetical protein